MKLSPQNPEKTTLSAIIIAKNEEQTIKRCLTSVGFADEIIVVIDSASTDKTALLAVGLNAKVFTRHWTGYGPQKNYGLSQAKGKWVLFIDADEEVTPKLRQEIIAAIKSAANDFYWLRIITVFLGKRLNHLYGHNARLFRRHSGQWTNAKVHEQVINKQGQVIKLGDNLSKTLEIPLLHYSHSTVKSYLNTMYIYTTLDAQQMFSTSRHRSGKPIKPGFYLPYFLAFRQFIKLLFYRRGFLDGYVGFLWSLLSAYYEYLMSKKYLALKNKH